MPVYEFDCDEHGFFEERKHLDDKLDGSECPVCGKMSRRIFSPSFIKVTGPHFCTGGSSCEGDD